jgi:hypothetical protein
MGVSTVRLPPGPMAQQRGAACPQLLEASRGWRASAHVFAHPNPLPRKTKTIPSECFYRQTVPATKCAASIPPQVGFLPMREEGGP